MRMLRWLLAQLIDKRLTFAVLATILILLELSITHNLEKLDEKLIENYQHLERVTTKITLLSK
jgi:hypothetical protein